MENSQVSYGAPVSPEGLRQQARHVVERVAAGAERFSFGSCWEQGFQLTFKNLGNYVGAAIVFTIMYCLGFLAILIPIIGTFLYMAFSFVIFSGFGIYARAALLGRPRRFGLFFEGFNSFGALFLLGILAALIPTVISLAFFSGTALTTGAIGPEALLASMMAIIPLMLVTMLILASLMFTPYLISMYGFSLPEALRLNFRIMSSQFLKVIIYSILVQILLFVFFAFVSFFSIFIGGLMGAILPFFISIPLAFFFFVALSVFAFSIYQNMYYLPFHQLVVEPAEGRAPASSAAVEQSVY